MPLSNPTNILNGVEAAPPVTSSTTGSYTPTASAGQMLVINARTTSSSQPPTPTITDSRGWTWTFQAKVDYDAAGTTDRDTIFLFTNLAASATSGTLTISFGAVSCAKIGWTVDQFTGIDQTTPFGTPATNVGAALTALTVTLASAASDSYLYGAFGNQVSTPAWSAEAGWTKLTENNQSLCSTVTDYKSGSTDLTNTMNWTGSSRAGGILIEVKAAAAGGSNLTQNVDDTLTLADALTMGIGKALADSVTPADALAMGVGLALADTATPSDAISLELGLSLTDSTTLADSIVLGPGLGLSDSLTLADALTTGIGLGLDDAVTLADALAKDIGLSIDDTVALADDLAKDMGLSLAETIALADAIDEATGKGATIDDAISLIDDLVFGVGLSLDDAITVADRISFMLNGQPYPTTVTAHARAYFVTRFGFYT